MTVSGGQVTTAAELVTRAKRLTPLVEEHADAADAKGMLSDEVVEAYHAADIVGTWTPRSVGGHEFGRTCMDVVNWVVDAAATVAVRPSVLQRHLRDMKTGAQHMTFGPGVRQNVGRMLAGDQAGKRWMFTELVDER